MEEKTYLALRSCSLLTLCWAESYDYRDIFNPFAESKFSYIFTWLNLSITDKVICYRITKDVRLLMKATEQYFPVVPFIMLYKVVQTF